MELLGEYLNNVKKVAITGHVSPDGDCIGSCLGLLNYLRDNYPQITAHVFLQEAKGPFSFLPLSEEIRHEDSNETYDMIFLLDISSITRISFAQAVYERTPKAFCIDHHITNPGGFTWTENDPTASSACEVLYRFLDPDKISKNCAVCLYTGIVHDTGVFQYSQTTSKTMQIAGVLMDKGVPFSKIIDESFFQKTFLQNRVMGEILVNSQLYLDGMLVFGTMSRERRAQLGAKSSDLDGVVAALRNTAGTDTAVFLYQLDDGMYKISMRSREIVDVSEVTALFGGGGHVRAAGAKTSGSAEEILKKILAAVEEQLKRNQSL